MDEPAPYVKFAPRLLATFAALLLAQLSTLAQQGATLIHSVSRPSVGMQTGAFLGYDVAVDEASGLTVAGAPLDDIGGSNHAQLSDEEFRQLTTPGTTLYNNWIGRLNTLAGFFQELKDAGVAVVFRPLHEMNQCVFWWACHTGANGSAQLYRITHDYLTNTKGLTNIVWAWNIQDFSSMPNDLSRYDPGSAYYDVLTLDIYESGFRQDYYDTMVNYAKGKPIAVGEVQYMPTADKLRQQPKWTWVMQWSDFIYDNDHMIADLYAAPNVTTLDEMPGW